MRRSMAWLATALLAAMASPALAQAMSAGPSLRM